MKNDDDDDDDEEEDGQEREEEGDAAKEEEEDGMSDVEIDESLLRSDNDDEGCVRVLPPGSR